MKYLWKHKERVSDDLVEQLLHNRGIGAEDYEVFLNPDWDRDTYDPFLFRQMNKAVELVFAALKNNKKIIIHGDYDADGVSGSALLWTTLNEIAESLGIKANIDVFLPDREKDGYGVALHTVENFIDQETNLLITVDCGIANADILEVAHRAGVEVIICDHHQLGERIPEYAVIIHPLAPGETYPNKKLCGTGVAFKLACALIFEARNKGCNFLEGHEKWLMDLVAIATVTDVMPLIGENRALEKFGLLALNKTRRPGLKKIIELSRSELGFVNTETIGFRIGPRINAAGRIASAKSAFNALVAKTESEAEKYTSELEILNRERQRITDLAYEEAKRLISSQQDYKVHVIWSDIWAPGIVGLVAGKITNEFGKPAFVLTKVDGKFVGSGRSAGGLHLVEAMRSCGDIFVKAGGHPEACGLTIADEKLVREFKDKVNIFANDFFSGESQERFLEIDAELPFEQASFEIFNQIKNFEPFGQGNPEPIFSSSAIVLKADSVGKTGDHLKIRLTNVNGICDLIGFGFGKLASRLETGTQIDVAYQISINEWNGNVSLQGKVVDISLKNG